MIEYEEAKKIVENKYPDYLLRTCYDYKNLYIFMISPGKNYTSSEDVAVMGVSVDKDTKKIALYNFWHEIYSNRDVDFIKSIENPIFEYKE